MHSRPGFLSLLCALWTLLPPPPMVSVTLGVWPLRAGLGESGQPHAWHRVSARFLLMGIKDDE